MKTQSETNIIKTERTGPVLFRLIKEARELKSCKAKREDILLNLKIQD